MTVEATKDEQRRLLCTQKEQRNRARGRTRNRKQRVNKRAESRNKKKAKNDEEEGKKRDKSRQTVPILCRQHGSSGNIVLGYCPLSQRREFWLYWVDISGYRVITNLRYTFEAFF